MNTLIMNKNYKKKTKKKQKVYQNNKKISSNEK